ncbi:MAG: GNAT family N-acetyltransferase [Acidobacteria bacterium]|nr:GNAT family N-acetyltransferase [Acidobacteriota bacterium]
MITPLLIPNPLLVSPPDLQLRIDPGTSWPEVAADWAELARCSADSSFFTTEAWVGTWMEVFGPLLDVTIAMFHAAEQLVGACLLVKGAPRWPWKPLRSIHVNAAGESAADTTYVEFNSLVCRRGWEEVVAQRLAGYLRTQSWDELALDGFVPGAAHEALKRAFAAYQYEELRHPSYYADLVQIRDSGETFEQAMGRTSRKHLRQNLRSFRQLGELHLDCSSGQRSALTMFEELAEFNRRRWLARKRQVVFASPHFAAFHRRLIEKCGDGGEVQLMRLAAGNRALGYLYHLVYGRNVYFYQCGFDYSIDDRLSPGTVAVSRAIQYYADRGYNSYDLLSGDAGYKRRLSTHSRQLIWAAFRRPGVRTALMRMARASKRWLADRIKAHSYDSVA